MKCKNCGFEIPNEMYEFLKKQTEGIVYCNICKAPMENHVSEIKGLTEIYEEYDQYPHPLAVCLKRLLDDINIDAPPLERLFSLRDLIEVSIKYLAIYQISVNMKYGYLSQEERYELISMLARPSLGTWRDILLYQTRKEKEKNPTSESNLYQLLFVFKNNKHQATDLCKQVNSFVTFRNDVIGHGARLSAEEYENEFSKWESIILSWNNLFEFLKQLQLIFVVNESFHNLIGNELSEQIPLPVNGSMYIEESNKNRFLINPFMFIHLCDTCNSLQLFFYDSNHNYSKKKNNPKVNALEYNSGHKPKLYAPVKDLEEFFGKELLQEAFKHVRFKIAEIEGKILTWNDLITDHANIIGRKFLIEQLKKYINEKSSGIYLISAEPGIGKTAFSSYLVENGLDTGDIRAHFFYRKISGTQSPNNFTKSIYYSLLNSFQINESNPTEDVLELRIKLLNLLKDISNNYLHTNEKCLIVVDGLDEASLTTDGNDAFDLLPKELPKGIYIIATSRLVTEINKLKTNKFVSYYELRANSKENIEDLLAYIKMKMPLEFLEKIDVLELAKHCKGNFLLAKLLIESSRAKDFEPRDFKSFLYKMDGLKNYYYQYWEGLEEQIKFKSAVHMSESIYEVLGVLSICKAPITEEIVVGSLELGIGRFERVLRYARQFLDIKKVKGEEEVYYQLFHETFREFIAEKIHVNRVNLHRKLSYYFLDILPDEPLSYGLRYKLFHLAQAGMVVEIFEWLKLCMQTQDDKLIMNEETIKNIILNLEDLKNDQPFIRYKQLTINKKIKDFLQEFEHVHGKSAELNVFEFILFLLQTKLGTEGLSVYFRYIVRTLPTPLAIIKPLINGNLPSEYKIWELIFVVEGILTFYRNICLAAYLDGMNSYTKDIKRIGRNILNPSLGSKVNLMRECIKNMPKEYREIFLDQQYSWFYSNGEEIITTKEFNAAIELIQERNKFAHQNMEKLDYEQVLTLLLDRLNTIIHSLQLFQEFKLVEILKLEKEKALVRVLHGEKSEGLSTKWISWSRTNSDIGQIFLISPKGKKICVSPFIKVFSENHQDIKVGLLDSTRLDKGNSIKLYYNNSRRDKSYFSKEEDFNLDDDKLYPNFVLFLKKVYQSI